MLPLYVAILVFILDFTSKFLTHNYLPRMRSSWLWYPYGGIGVFKDFFGIEFSLSHQINQGAAWGLFRDFQMPLLYLRIVLVIFLIVYAFWLNKQKNWSIPLALIISGAACNIFDYFLYGHVVDMLHFILWGYDFPVFNIADSAICIGIVWIIILSIMEKK